MENQIKILSVNTSDTSGGAARAAYRIHCGVRKLGVNSCMFVKNKQLDDESILSLSTFVPVNVFYKLYRYVQHKIKNKIQHFRWNRYPDREDVFMSDLRSVPLHGALKKLDFDILHLHWINLRFLNLQELIKVNKPIVWTLHDSWAFTCICHYTYDCDKYTKQCGTCPFLRSTHDNDLSRQVWNVKNKLYPKLNLHIVTPSAWLASMVKQSTLLKHFPVTVIPNCLDTTIYKPIEKAEALTSLQLKADKKKILFGAVNAFRDVNKGFNLLIEAIHCIGKNMDCNRFELLVFGADKPIAEISTKMEVHYLGYVRDEAELVKIYNVADVMVVPSLSEVFGQTASEAMACGTPVVAFNCTGIKEVVEHKISGYLADPYNPEELAAGIVWCLDNNTSGKLSRNARKKVEENYSMERVGEKYVDLYNELIK